MKQKKLTYRAVVSLVLSAVLFTMPAMAFTMNENNAVSVRAEDLTEDTSGHDVQKSETEESTTESDKDSESGADNTEGGKKPETEESTERTGSGNAAPEPVCTCEEKCSAYAYDKDCTICVEDYKDCTYKKPNVVITINQPEGWYSDTTSVTFGVRDVAATGNFEVST